MPHLVGYGKLFFNVERYKPSFCLLAVPSHCYSLLFHLVPLSNAGKLWSGVSLDAVWHLCLLQDLLSISNSHGHSILQFRSNCLRRGNILTHEKSVNPRTHTWLVIATFKLVMLPPLHAFLAGYCLIALYPAKAIQQFMLGESLSLLNSV